MTKVKCCEIDVFHKLWYIKEEGCVSSYYKSQFHNCNIDLDFFKEIKQEIYFSNQVSEYKEYTEFFEKLRETELQKSLKRCVIDK